jgi:hypothetical protein
MKKYSAQIILQRRHGVYLRDNQLKLFQTVLDSFHSALIKHRKLLRDVPFEDLTPEMQKKLIDTALTQYRHDRRRTNCLLETKVSRHRKAIA